MYTSNAYFPSPIDGNYYPTYIYLQSGQLSPVHFLKKSNGLELVYYPISTLGQVPAPVSAQVSIQNGFSNLVYFQPQQYGQVQQLYCTSVEPRRLTLIVNPEFQQFIPINVYDSKPQYNESTEIIPHAAFMEQNPNRVPVNAGASLPPEITQGLQAVQNGSLTNVSVTSNQYGFQLTAEDHQGNRYILEKHSQNGINSTSETTIETSNDKLVRQQQVKQLRENKMTQSQIANHLGVSQKTISNDIKELGLR
jgi:HTH domain.